MPEKNDWVSIRNAWESGVSKNQVAKDFGVSVTAVTAHQKKEGWTRADAEPVGTPATVDLSEHPLVESHDKVAELEAEIARLKAEVQGQKREAHIPMLDTPEQVLAFYGYDRLANIAAKRINRERKQDGFLAVEFAEKDPRLDKPIRETIEIILERKTSEAGKNNLRTIKMALPDRKQPGGFKLAALPVEENFNNERANPGANVRFYQRKGWLMVVPFRCRRGPCWAKAAVDAGGQFVFDGYCSREHLADDPVANARKIPGVTTSVRMIPA